MQRHLQQRTGGGADTFHTFLSVSATSFKSGTQRSGARAQNVAFIYYSPLPCSRSLSCSSLLSGSSVLEVPLTQPTLQRNDIARIIFAKGEDHHYSKGRIFQTSCIILPFQHLLYLLLNSHNLDCGLNHREEKSCAGNEMLPTISPTDKFPLVAMTVVAAITPVRTVFV